MDQRALGLRGHGDVCGQADAHAVFGDAGLSAQRLQAVIFPHAAHQFLRQQCHRALIGALDHKPRLTVHHRAGAVLQFVELVAERRDSGDAQTARQNGRMALRAAAAHQKGADLALVEPERFGRCERFRREHRAGGQIAETGSRLVTQHGNDAFGGVREVVRTCGEIRIAEPAQRIGKRFARRIHNALGAQFCLLNVVAHGRQKILVFQHGGL